MARRALALTVRLCALLAFVGCGGGGGGGGASVTIPASLLPMLLAGAACLACDPVSTVSLEDVARLEQGAAGLQQPWVDRLGVIEATAAMPVVAAGYLGADPAAFRAEHDTQSRVALARAIRAHTSGAYEVAARTYLLSWAESLPGITSVQQTTDPINAGLHVGLQISRYTAVYSLLWDQSMLTDDESNKIRAWLYRVYQLERSAMDLWDGVTPGGPNPCHRYSNHAGVHLEAAAAAIAAIGDHDTWQAVIRPRYELLLERQLYGSGETAIGCEEPGTPTEFGQVYDRYRHYELLGHGYSLLTLQHLATAAEIAGRFTGEDWFVHQGPNGESLLEAARYHGTILRSVPPGDTFVGGYYDGEVAKPGHLALFEHLAPAMNDPELALNIAHQSAHGHPRVHFPMRHFGHGL